MGTGMDKEQRRLSGEFLLFLAAVSSAFFVYIIHMQNHYYQQVITLIGRAERKNAGLGSELASVLFSDAASSEYENGLQVVRAAGYEQSSLSYLRGQAVSGVHAAVFLIVILLAGMLCYYSRRTQMRRVRSEMQVIENCLESMADTSRSFELPAGVKDSFWLQESLERLASRINHQIREVHTEKEQMSVFLENISHQLKTPLSGMMLYLDHLHQTETDEERQERLSLCLRQASVIQNIITTLLRYAQLDSGRLSMEMKKENLTDIVSRCLVHVEPFVDEKRITLHTDIPAICPVMCNRFWLGEALENVLKNAVEHTPAGGDVFLHLSEENSWFVLRVRDSGTGIKPEDIKHIFERFYQADPRLHQNGRFGIGLSLAKEVAERQGGSLSATDHPAGGAVFSFRFPVLYGTQKTVIL